MSLLNNLIEQVKANEKLNHCRFINSIHTKELDEFFKECKEHNQIVYPSWISIEQIYSRKKKSCRANNSIVPGTVFVIDDNQESISSRTRSKTNSLPNNTQYTQISLDGFINNNLSNLITTNDRGRGNSNSKSSRGKKNNNTTNNNDDDDVNNNNDNDNQTSRSKKSKKNSTRGKRNPFARKVFRGRGRGRSKGRVTKAKK